MSNEMDVSSCNPLFVLRRYTPVLSTTLNCLRYFMIKHTPLNCNTCDLGKELKDDERFRLLKIKSCHKCSEFLIKYEEREDVERIGKE